MSRRALRATPRVNWHGDKRTNETHVSPNDPQTLFHKDEVQAANVSFDAVLLTFAIKRS